MSEITTSRTPAETLRAAAAKLRETAVGVTPDRWQLLTYQIVATFDDECEHITEVAFTHGHTGNARWIALVGPLLAEPFAAWLDWAAIQADNHPVDLEYGGHPEFRWCLACQEDEPACAVTTDRALAVARVILGETEKAVTA